jgi:hypothetical protein
MWWEPANERERSLRDKLARVNDELYTFADSEGGVRTRSGVIHGIHGVGSAIGTDGRVPLIVLDLGFAPNQRRDQRSNRREMPRYVLGDVDQDIQVWLRRYDLPSDTQILFADPPRPAFRANTNIWAGEKTATIGSFLRLDDGRLVATTAGHLVDAVPCNIELRNGRLFGPYATRFGSVQIANDPRERPGVDIAIIELARGEEGVPQMRQAAAVDENLVVDLGQVTLRGAKSGIRRGWLNGDAYVAVRAFDGRAWTNCWNINEISNGCGQPGDSGGVVIDGTDALLGHLVATFGVRRANGYQCGLVQDMATILEYVQQQTGLWAEPMIAEWPKEDWATRLRRKFLG